MIKKTLLIIAVAFIALTSAYGQTTDKLIEPDGTYMFVKRDTCDLFLDVYNPAKGSKTTLNGKSKPTIVFIPAALRFVPKMATSSEYALNAPINPVMIR